LDTTSEPIAISAAMLAAASAECPALAEDTIKRVLETGLPYSMKRFQAACATSPELAEHVVDAMLDAAIAAIP